MDNNEFKKEKENLQSIIEKYREIMQYYNLRLEAIPRIYMNNPTMIKNSIEMYSEKIRLMEKSINKPYFASLDFARDGEQKLKHFILVKLELWMKKIIILRLTGEHQYLQCIMIAI